MTTPTAQESIRSAIAAIETRNPQLGAFVSVFADEALSQARQYDTVPSPTGPIAGMPVVIKDIYDIAGHPTGNGSAASPTGPAVADAEAVRRLRAAGAIVIGKVSTHEYAWGVNTPATRNPHDPSRIPGGSSGGTAAAIAAGMAVAGLGTDTGGSIRIPAALCGIAGLKPTFGRVSRRGVSSLSWTMDHTGPMGSTTREVTAVLQSIAGFDASDPYSVDVPVPRFDADLDRGVAGLTIGVSERYFCDRLTPAVATAFESTVRSLEDSGARIVDVPLPDLYVSAEIITPITTVETVAWHSAQADIAPDKYGPDMVAAISQGRDVSAVDYANALHAKHQLTRDLVTVFDNIDLLISPTTVCTAPAYGADTMTLGTDPVSMLPGLTELTRPANITGIPALSVPIGADRGGLPIGLQIMGAPWTESLVLAAGSTIEVLVSR